jgi:hypothetical protein
MNYTISIPDTFPVSTLTGKIVLSSKKRQILTARTREGKTLLALLCGCSIKEAAPETIVILVSPDLGAAIDDCKGKMDFFEELQDTGVELLSYKDNRTELAEEFMSPMSDRIFVMNANHIYVEKLVQYAQKSAHPIVLLLDEAHKGGPKTYKRILDEVATLDHVAVLETTATYRDRVLTHPHGEVIKLIPRGAYLPPTAATLIPVDEWDNSYARDTFSLSDIHLDEIVRECGKEKCLILINGGADQAYHYNAKNQISDALRELGDEIAIIKITGGKATWSDLNESVQHEIVINNSRKPIRDASAIIKSVYDKGYRKIIVLGQRQVEMGQTIGFAGFPLTLQIMHCAKGKQQADSIAQWIRTGGIGIDVEQRIMMVESKWNDYLRYIEASEELRDVFEGLTPKEQQKAAEKMYLELDTLRVKNGSYTPVDIPPDVSTLPVITDYVEFPLEPWMQDQLNYVAGEKRNSLALREWLKLKIDEVDPDKTFPRSIRTCAGTIQTTKEGRGGNDIQIYVHQDPSAKSGEAWNRNIVVWMRDDRLCVRLRKSLEPQIGLTHNYWGNLQCFVKNIPGTETILAPTGGSQ